MKTPDEIRPAAKERGRKALTPFICIPVPLLSKLYVARAGLPLAFAPTRGESLSASRFIIHETALRGVSPHATLGERVKGLNFQTVPPLA